MLHRRLAGVVLLLMGLGLIAAGPAQATGKGHQPVLVCHNRDHNPVLITVDASSTSYQGHLKHRTEGRDLIQGLDGNAAAITAGCTPPEVTQTLPTHTVTVPGPTVTETGPAVTITGTPTVTVTGSPTTIPGPTVTGPATEVPGPTTTGPAVTVPGPTTTGPAVEVPGPTRTGEAVVIPGPTTTGKATVVAAPKPHTPLVTGPKGSLAFTGPNVGVGALGLLLLGLGVVLIATGRRIRVVRP